MKDAIWICSIGFLVLMSCSPPSESYRDPYPLTHSLDSIKGKSESLASPYVTAGDRVYMIGNQDGSFPDLGWHIEGEMGGIWDHPIKLLDGFSAKLQITDSDESYCLDKATSFVNYPVANVHNYKWDKENIAVKRFQFVPDSSEGVVVEFIIQNNDQSDKKIDFSFEGITDLRPTWLGERSNMIDAADEIRYEQKLSAAIAKDKHNPWYVAFGSTLIAKNFSNVKTSCSPTAHKGSGVAGTLSYSITLKPHEINIIPLFIAGSAVSEEALLKTFASLKSTAYNQFTKKIERYHQIELSSQLAIPDQDLNQMYQWLKYNVDWLKRSVPGQGIGLSAGLPDYPWWFGADATYALHGVLATGDHELVKNTIILLHDISQKKNGNGRIIHEVSTNGEVYNPGNVNETPQFITLLLKYYQWTGDKELIQKLYPDVKKGIGWLLEKDADKNGYPDGSGMMEIPGLDTEMIDVAVYTQQGLASAAELAKQMGDTSAAQEYSKLAEDLKLEINKDWWQQSARSFGDFRGTIKEAKPIIDAALVRSDTLKKPWAVAELKETQKQLKNYGPNDRIAHVVYHNWVVNTPLETGIADKNKGRIALENAKTYENAFGVFVTGLDRTQEPDSVVLKSRKKTFSYAGAVMTLPTGVLAVSAANYGTPEDVLFYLNKLKRSFSYALPGSMYEVSPDFGMVTQAWNIYGVAVPIVEQFFGIHPTAYEKTILISPNLPKAWTDVSISNVHVGNTLLNLSINQKDGKVKYHIQIADDTWKIQVAVPDSMQVKLNGKDIGKDDVKDGKITTLGNDIKVTIY